MRDAAGMGVGGGMSPLSGLFERVRNFERIVVHPTQELPIPSADFYRGGPDWPDFRRQVLVRHCWGAIPRAVDLPPHPAETEFPYFDPERYLNPRRKPAPHPPARWVDTAETGIWCGPITDHFGHMIADFGMRIAVSARLDRRTPLVFGIWPVPAAEPPPYFWQMLDHLGVDRQRVMLVRKPTRFERLSVVPQAERPYGGWANRRHLRLMDDIAGRTRPAGDREEGWVFVSRSGLPWGRFAAESYLDEALAAAGVTIFCPETVDLHTQLHLYRRSRRVVFSEGSALQALQLLGHVDAEVAILPRRPGRMVHNMASVWPLRARVRSLRRLPTLKGAAFGRLANGAPNHARGISVFDERRLIAALAVLGIDLARVWEPRVYAARRDADIAAWREAWLARALHDDEPAFIDRQLRALPPQDASL